MKDVITTNDNTNEKAQVGFPRIWKRTAALTLGVLGLVWLTYASRGGQSYWQWREEHYHDEADLEFNDDLPSYDPPKDPMISWGYVSPSSSILLSHLQPWQSSPSTAETDLGQEARDAYDLSVTTLESYISQLEDFASVSTFPAELVHELRSGIARYLTPASLASGHGSASKPRLLPEWYGVNSTVWQTDRAGETSSSFAVKTWRDHHAPDEGWAYHSLTNEGADAWIASQFPLGTRVRYLWDNLGVGILKADVLRYLLLLVHGGVYSDTDTECLKPMETWAGGADLWKPESWASPSDLKRISRGDDHEEVLGKPSVVVGIEVDVQDRGDWHTWWPRPLQVVQWTMASAPNHPIALSALLRITHRTAKAADWASNRWAMVQRALRKNDTESAIELMRTTALDEPGQGGPVGIMDWTGPGVWTDSVLQYLEARYNCPWTELRGLERPLRIGDVVVLPVTGFSPEVGQFGSQGRDHPLAMVWHYFRGSWKGDGGGIKEAQDHEVAYSF